MRTLAEIRAEKLLARIMAGVDSRDPTACWEWRNGRDNNGYGQVSVKVGRKHKVLRVHRAIYELLHGELASAVHVCHTCDNPPCCNPAHLFTGDHLRNMQDKAAKGRAARNEGTKKWSAKLTEVIVLESRRRRLEGESIESLAEEFGVAYSTMCNALSGTTWKHV